MYWFEVAGRHYKGPHGRCRPLVTKEPRPLPGLPPLEQGDFHALSEPLCRDPQYNDRRLVARRKLGAIAKETLARIGRLGPPKARSAYEFLGVPLPSLWTNSR